MGMTVEPQPAGPLPKGGFRPALKVPIGRFVRVPSWWRDAVGAFTWANILIVVALWIGDGQVQAFSGWASGAVSFGRLVGLVSADLLLIQVLLMARIPMV
jgi:hypothetical protein